MEPIESLSRRESGRMVAALTRVFGVHNLSLVEDVVQDAFCRAMEIWKFRGMPDKPAAWLMTVAKNRALDVLRRERTARTFAPEITRLLESEWTLVPTLDEQFAPDAIKDDLLRLMFSCCDPRLREESQVALVLHILCGFSVDETAGAFVATHAAMEKRLTRAKKVLAQSARLFDVADGVLRTAPRGPARAVSAVQRGISRRLARVRRARGAVPRGHSAGGAAAGAPAGIDAGNRCARGAHVPQRRPASRADGRGGRPPRPRRSGSEQMGSGADGRRGAHAPACG